CPSGQALYPTQISSCGTINVAGVGLACSPSGFVGNDPRCGHTGAFLTCTPILSVAGLVIGCSASGPSQVTQQCH
ncbi:MAG TPA: hypothetical protein VKU41_01885, partial [Polyangiaceae bacterium]|nr:hypothetical protein [Polyangiaceae bacterium]